MNIDLFHLYRRLLSLVVAVYVVVNTVSLVNRWLVAPERPSRTESFVRGYVSTLLLRTRIRRFAWELVQIALLSCLLAYLVLLHW